MTPAATNMNFFKKLFGGSKPQSAPSDQSKANYLNQLKQEFLGLPTPALATIAIRSARRVESTFEYRNTQNLLTVTRERIRAEESFGFSNEERE
jgi:hypothetical protein